MYILFALLTALFAAFTAVLSKIGIENVNSNLATAIRTIVILFVAWGMVFITGSQSGIAQIGKKSWIFLILSGIATGISWLCYYKALQLGSTAKVASIDKFSIVITLILSFVILREQVSLKMFIGVVLITAGTLFMVM